MKVSHPATSPLSELNELGVAIGILRVPYVHVGILYKLDDGMPRMCDLAWHFMLRDLAPIESMFWVQSALEEVERRVVASAVAAMDKTQRIPYGTRYDDVLYFEGRVLRYYRPDAPGEGLTCATFVMAVFEALSLPLLVVDGWPARDTDRDWQVEIIQHLRTHKEATPEHIAALEASTDGIRFRPEEVAAAVGSDDCPLTYAVAEARGAKISRIVRQAPAA